MCCSLCAGLQLMDRRKSLRKKAAAEGANNINRLQLTNRRKSLRKKVAVEGANDIDSYIHPQKFRDKSATVINHSSLLLLAEVRNLLSVDEQAIFKGTAIGHLLSVPDDSKFSGTIVHFLLSREIQLDDKPEKMHFKVGGKVLHFGKREFALITGLSFNKSEKFFISSLNPSSLMRKHFPNQDHVSASEVKDLLSKNNSACPSLDRVKLALLLVVHNFLMSRQYRQAINISYWHLVDDLEEFNKYPWGEVTFARISKFRLPLIYQANKENSGAGGEPSYTVVGIAHALVVWALAIMPGLLNLCGRKIESRSWQPHMLCVLCTKSPFYPSLIQILDVNDVHVCSDMMWQKGDGNQLIMLGLEEGTTESSSSIQTEKEKHEHHVEESSLRDSFHEKKDCDQGHEVPEQAPDFLSKKREISTEESRPGEGKGISNYEPEHLPSSEHITIPAIPILQTDWESSPDRDAARCLVDLASASPSKKRKISAEESLPCERNGICNYESEHLPSSEPIRPSNRILQESVAKENENDVLDSSGKDSRGKDVSKGNISFCSEAKTTGNISSCSGAETTGAESLEVGELVEGPADATTNISSFKGLPTADSTLLNILTSIDIIPYPPGFPRASAQERAEGFEYVDNFKIPEEYVTLYKKIYEKHGHMATKKVVKFNDDMLLTCVASLLKIISAMEYVRGSELSEALLERWEGFLEDAETLEFNIKWLREGLNRLKNHWRSSFGIDREVESHAQVLDAMQVKYVSLSTREDELNAELSEVKIQKKKAEAMISFERKAIQEKLSQKIKLQNESVAEIVLS
ncbi:uncharacterized protein LOC113310636 isoform X2 [Papaver somniferum]|uniref:uncharacterized protein LOC113310636 isoform X2 n=1 Tax=Papaver somniferum TaxID=3469 RepID=UPI000E7040B2|nr:uncharacterized protein LOC113310636 isoform X2 [Papaver somniferum]